MTENKAIHQEEVQHISELLQMGKGVFTPAVYEPLVRAYANRPVVVLDRIGVLTPLGGNGLLHDDAVPALQALDEAGYSVVIWTGDPRRSSQVTLDDMTAKLGADFMARVPVICRENYVGRYADDYDYVVNHLANRGVMNAGEANELRAMDFDGLLTRTKSHHLLFPEGTPLIDDTGDIYSCNLAGPLEQYPHTRPIGVPKDGLLPLHGKSILQRWPILNVAQLNAMDPTPRQGAFSVDFLKSAGLIHS